MRIPRSARRRIVTPHDGRRLPSGNQAIDRALDGGGAPHVLQQIDALAAARSAEADLDVTGAEAEEPQPEQAVNQEVVAETCGVDQPRGEILAAFGPRHPLADRTR